jgi:RNA polymerase sigma-70 factor (ECF subfamily)
MQDTFVKLLTYQETLTDDAPSSLLFKMSTRVCLNHLRKKKEDLVEDHDSQISILEKIAFYDSMEQRYVSRDFLSKIFKTQSESTAVIAVLYYLDQMTLEEVAQEVALSVSGVRKRLKAFNDKVKILKEIQ